MQGRGGVDSQGGQQAVIWDPVLQMPAYTVDLPLDWSFEAVVLRGSRRGEESPAPVFRAASADGRSGAQLLPPSSCYLAEPPALLQMQGLGGCTVGRIGLDEYIAQLIPALRPGAEVVAVEVAPAAPGFRARLKALNDEFHRAAAQVGNPNPWSVSGDMKRARIRHEHQGAAAEEWIRVGQTLVDRTANYFAPPRPGFLPQPLVGHVHHTLHEVITMRAPAGRLDEEFATLASIHGSLRIVPAYQQRLAALSQQNFALLQQQSAASFRNVLAAGQAAARQRLAGHRAHMETMARQAEQRREGFAAQQAQKSQNVRAFIEQQEARSGRAHDRADALLDQQRYVNPATGEVTTLSNQYDASFADGQGHFAQTNSPTFDPNTQLPGYWTQLQAIRHSS